MLVKGHHLCQSDHSGLLDIDKRPNLVEYIKWTLVFPTVTHVCGQL